MKDDNNRTKRLFVLRYRLLNSVIIAIIFCHGIVYANTIPEGIDFATTVLHDVWDMSNEEDMFSLRWVDNLSDASIQNGVFTGIPKDSDPHMWLHFPQIASSIPTLDQKPQDIDADTYHVLSYYLWLPDDLVPGSTQAVGRIVWHFGGETADVWNNNYSESTLFPVYPGWHLYTIDLESVTTNGAGPWAGTVEGLRIDPCFGCSEFQIDWARLVSPGASNSNLTLAGTNNTKLLVGTAADTNYLTVVDGSGDGTYDLSILPPGNYFVTPIDEDDYALSQIGNPWDMDTISDLIWSSLNDWTNATMNNGEFVGTTNGSDPYLILNVPPDKPIDTSKYRYLNVSMSFSNVPGDEPGMIIYWGGAPVTFSYSSGFIPIQSAQKVYTIDLSQYSGWSGDILALRVDPLGGANSNGVEVKIDYISLTGTSGGNSISPALETAITINATPQVEFVTPSAFTGTEYSATVLGNTWEMDTANDVVGVQNISDNTFVTTIPDLGISGDFYTGLSTPLTPAGDPGVWVLFQENALPIDADQYPLLAVKLYVPFDVNDANELSDGAVVRVAWKVDDLDGGRTTDDILMQPGLHTYLLDMSTVKYEPESSQTWTGSVRYLRIDPHEFSNPKEFYIDSVSVLTLPQTGSQFYVTFDLTNAEVENLTATVFVDNIQVAQQSGLLPGVHTIFSDISSFNEGEHTLQMTIADSYNVVSRELLVPFYLDKTIVNTESPPSAPALNLTTDGITVNLSWTSLSTATGYRLSYAPQDISYVADIDIGNQTSISFDLSAGAAFYVAVQAYNDTGISDFSNVEFFAIP